MKEKVIEGAFIVFGFGYVTALTTQDLNWFMGVLTCFLAGVGTYRIYKWTSRKLIDKDVMEL